MTHSIPDLATRNAVAGAGLPGAAGKTPSTPWIGAPPGERSRT